MKCSTKGTLRKAIASLGLLLPICGLAGCNSGGGAEITKQDEANFKGGPMPASAAEAMKKSAEQSKAGAPK